MLGEEKSSFLKTAHDFRNTLSGVGKTVFLYKNTHMHGEK
jgi:hypothetical protein